MSGRLLLKCSRSQNFAECRQAIVALTEAEGRFRRSYNQMIGVYCRSRGSIQNIRVYAVSSLSMSSGKQSRGAIIVARSSSLCHGIASEVEVAPAVSRSAGADGNPRSRVANASSICLKLR
jgi:hypothetical protein